MISRLGAPLGEALLWLALLMPMVALGWLAGGDQPSPEACLLEAAQSDDVGALQAALCTASGVEVTDTSGFTPLMIAARAGHTDAVSRLLDHGARINAQTPASGTALMQAALYGREDVVKLLLARHADPNCHTDHGQTALWYAVISGSSSPVVVQSLIAAGAKPIPTQPPSLN